jgi:hypothetical protein
VRLLQGTWRTTVNRVPRWRIALAVLVLAGLVFLLAVFTPIYFSNLKLQSFVSDVTQHVENHAKSDDLLRTMVVDKAQELRLPVAAENVHISRAAGGALETIDVRYAVEVNLPGYTVNLHFYPGAGSR